MRVLHVAEALGGGLAVALEGYVAVTPDLTHFVLAARRPEANTGDSIAELATLIPLPAGSHRRRVSAVLAAIDSVRPHIVHGHSSFGGAYARIAAGIRGVPVVYTPHCYAFERRDTSTAARAMYAIVETALGTFTNAVVAVSPREADLARRLRQASIIEYAPHVAPPRVAQPRRHPGATPLCVAMAGRICPQKDPSFFGEAARAAARIAPGATSWQWIGGGDSALESTLRAAGVAVTGWSSREEALKRLTDSHLYAHSAAWEGAPLTLLEAAALGLPLVVRTIDATASLGLGDGRTPVELAQAVLALQEQSNYDEKAAAAHQWAGRFDSASQRAALISAYSRVAYRRDEGVVASRSTTCA